MLGGSFALSIGWAHAELILWQIATIDSGQDTKTTTLGVWRMNRSEQIWRGADAWKEHYGVIVWFFVSDFFWQLTTYEMTKPVI